MGSVVELLLLLLPSSKVPFADSSSISLLNVGVGSIDSSFDLGSVSSAFRSAAFRFDSGSVRSALSEYTYRQEYTRNSNPACQNRFVRRISAFFFSPHTHNTFMGVLS